MSEREIEMSEIQVGDRIRAEGEYSDLKLTREGVVAQIVSVGTVSDPTFYYETENGVTVASTTWFKGGFGFKLKRLTLVHRPNEKPDEPTGVGAVIRAIPSMFVGGSDRRLTFVRLPDNRTEPARVWAEVRRDKLTDYVTTWDNLWSVEVVTPGLAREALT